MRRKTQPNIGTNKNLKKKTKENQKLQLKP